MTDLEANNKHVIIPEARCCSTDVLANDRWFYYFLWR